jgi:hypothetical protein
MNTKFNVLAGLLAVMAAVACGDDSTTGTGGTTSSVGGEGGTGATGANGGNGGTGAGGDTGGGGAMPAVPELGAQLDRFGRPAINTALNETFLLEMGVSTTAARGAAQDAYNKDSNETMWATTYAPTMARQLGVIDGLDGTCGTQLLACPAGEQGTKTNIQCYGGLAGVLASDRQWLRPTNTSCSTFLGVEADATGVIPNMDCGGRRPKDDVIDVEYSILAAGAPSGVSDGIAAPANLHPETFPYLADPL